MAWTARLYDKGITNGVVIAVVEYSNGTDKFNETYTYTGIPSTNWIPNIVYNRIAQLDGQHTTNIPTGQITPINPTTEIVVSTSQQDWDRRWRQFQRIDLLLKYNLIPTTDADLQALKTYLINNWKTFIKETV